MSPLWSDLALARAALAKVAEQDKGTLLTCPKPRKPHGAGKDRPRQMLRPRLGSLAL